MTPLISRTDNVISKTGNVISLTDKRALGVSLTGGKGANLARLIQAGRDVGFDVPGGWVITADMHDVVMAPVSRFVRKIERTASDDHDGLSRAFKGLTSALIKAPFPKALSEALMEFLETSTGPVAVRSSATCEDSGAAAFAGQHDTFLNVCGRTEIMTAIKKCFASFHAPQAVIYRRQAGASADAKMAVVVQAMAQCDRAGVAFSLHPVTGALDHTVINANFGLGESVVSGEADVDQFVFDRTRRKIAERHVGGKAIQITSAPAGGITQSQNSTTAEACLSDEEIEQIADLSEAVAGFMGYPQDIEWGYEGARLVLLQSRPITRLPERLTRDESAERFPGPVTPMTWGLVEQGFHRSLATSFDLMGLPPLEGKWFVEKDYYIYGNQTAVELYHGLAASSNSAFDLSAEGLAALAVKLARIDLFARDWHVNLERYITEIAVLGNRPLDGLSLAEQWDHVEANNEACARFFEPNIAVSLFHTGLSKALEGALLAGEDRTPHLIDDLKAGIHTRTAYVNRQLRKMADLARGNADLTEILASLDAAGKNAETLLSSGLFAKYSAFETAFADFIRDFGHREVDFDPYHAPWGDAPEVLIAQITALMEADCPPLTDEAIEKTRAEGRARAFAARQLILQAAPPEAALVLSELMDLVCYFEELDDLEHYSTSRVTRPIRRALLAVGETLVETGVLETRRDVWMINPDTMRQVLKAESDTSASGLWQDLAGDVRRARTDYDAAIGTAPEWEPGQAASSNVSDDNTLQGLPGSAGSVEGEVFVLESAADFKNFPKGAILVARTTNPAWTPLFYAAAAVITESGGPLSHGAVTAREIGIPAVMSVRSALTKLYNGLRVHVDGTTGRIELLEAAS